jgi:lantibiotic modifying enzyme
MEPTRKKAEAILSSLDLVLKKRFDPGVINPSLSAGHPGVALFYSAYYKLTGHSEHLDYCRQLAERCGVHFAENETIATYCDGKAGMGWVYQHLLNQDLIESPGEDALEDYDEYLAKTGELMILSGKYDYFHGGLGMGIYFLVRPDNKRYLERILAALERTVYVTPEGSFWEDLELRHHQKIEGRIVNFGLAHGMPSIIFFLTKLVELQIEVARATILLKDSIRYLLHYSNAGNYEWCHFPTVHFVEPDKRSTEFSRLAWCYGDLGVIASLLQAAKALRDDVLEKQVTEMGIRTTRRKSYEHTRIRDGGICHGYAGAAHVYQRLYRYTGVPVFEETSHYWISKLVDFIEENGGIDRFQEYSAKQDRMIDSFGMLTGATGAGLVLLSFLEPKASEWDRFFLLS